MFAEDVDGPVAVPVELRRRPALPVCRPVRSARLLASRRRGESRPVEAAVVPPRTPRVGNLPMRSLSEPLLPALDSLEEVLAARRAALFRRGERPELLVVLRDLEDVPPRDAEGRERRLVEPEPPKLPPLRARLLLLALAVERLLRLFPNGIPRLLPLNCYSSLKSTVHFPPPMLLA